MQISRPFTGGQKSILVVPLDWGLGHATRCIPLIRYLFFRGHLITIAAEGKILSLLKDEFPEANFIEKTGYRISYPSHRNFFKVKMALQVPKILKAIREERKWLRSLLSVNHFDAVISDNRYGLYSKQTASVIITHQLFIETGLGNLISNLVQKKNLSMIRRFKACWIPDYDSGIRLAGRLSNPPFKMNNLTYLGPLSALELKPSGQPLELVILISGPEPQRTIFEQLVWRELSGFRGTGMLIRGLPGEVKAPGETKINQVTVLPHLNRNDLSLVLSNAELVICRSGYSSIMDLVKLGKKAILVPTPGQPEQEYLARHLHSLGIFSFMDQESFSLQAAINEAATFPFTRPGLGISQYESVLDRFIQSLEKGEIQK